MKESVHEVEVPEYFICPISLQIMKDPVTTITGITYDREGIEQWLSSSSPFSTNNYCPITKLLLPKETDLTPNHILRRLIQAWCRSVNSSNGFDRIPTLKPPLNKTHVLKLIQDLSTPHLQFESLKKLQNLADQENEMNRKSMVEAGIIKAMVSFITKMCFKNEKITTPGLEEALSVLDLMMTSMVMSKEELKVFVMKDEEFFYLMTWVLSYDGDNHEVIKTNAISILKSTIELVSNASILHRLKHAFFEGVVKILREKISLQATKASLSILFETSLLSRNRIKIIEVGVVSELIELEFETPEKRMTELILGILDNLCSCADGRAEFLDHAGGIALISKRILRVSEIADSFAIGILGSICRFLATNEVLQEMLNVGAVSKLCMVLQAESATHVKDKARSVLRLHSNFWINSPCIPIYLLTRQIES